jgi:hypothetical protein
MLCCSIFFLFLPLLQLQLLSPASGADAGAAGCIEAIALSLENQLTLVALARFLEFPPDSD